MRLAVIPARGGSKRIPRKNIRPFCGKPMIAHSIDAARATEIFDAVIVSTDDPEIAEIARDAGAETPFLRPAELADDFATTTAVIRHAVEWMTDAGWNPQEICCLYATAPLVQAADILEGHRLLADPAVTYAFSATSFGFPIQRGFFLDQEGGIRPVDPAALPMRSQDLPEAFHDAGQFYFGRAASWRAELPVFSSSSRPVLLPRHRVQDIDTPEDWRRAELLYNLLRAS